MPPLPDRLRGGCVALGTAVAGQHVGQFGADNGWPLFQGRHNVRQFVLQRPKVPIPANVILSHVVVTQCHAVTLVLTN